MARRLSFQQIQILKRLSHKSCSGSELNKMYIGCNGYRSLNLLIRKSLVSRFKNKYYITKKGLIVLKAFT